MPFLNMQNNQSRMVALDCLRAVAVLLVIGRHAPPDPITQEPIASLLRTWRRGGWIGVDLFFVLSGFLVAGLLFKEYLATGNIRYFRFIIRRGFKIYPSFYVLILATLIISTLYRAPIERNKIISEVLFIQNYFPRIWNHTWSLAVEEHFYLLLPLTLALLNANLKTGRALHSIPWVCLSIMIITLVSRIYTASIIQPFDGYAHLYPTHLRADSLAFGVVLAYWHHMHPQTIARLVASYKRLIVLAQVLCIVPAFILPLDESVFMYTFGFTMLYFGFGGMLLVVLDMPSVGSHFKGSITSWLATIGQASYSIYLWHLAVLLWGQDILAFLLASRPDPFFMTCTYIIGSLAIGLLMARLIEFPALRLRERFVPRSVPGAL